MKFAQRIVLRGAAIGMLAATVLVAAAACETVKGAGKDLQNASEATERAITK